MKKKLLKVARTEEFLQTPIVARYNRDRFDDSIQGQTINNQLNYSLHFLRGQVPRTPALDPPLTHWAEKFSLSIDCLRFVCTFMTVSHLHCKDFVRQSNQRFNIPPAFELQKISLFISPLPPSPLRGEGKLCSNAPSKCQI